MKKTSFSLRPNDVGGDNLIISAILIYMNDFEDLPKMQFVRSYPYALDRKKKILIVMNQHHNFLKIQDQIKSLKSVKNIELHTDEVPEYRALYDYCKAQIIRNLEGTENIKSAIEFANGPGMSRYYFRIRCYRNLLGIDVETYNRLIIEEIK